MPEKADFNTVFSRLKEILTEYEAQLDVKNDTEREYYLDSFKINPINKKAVFFACVSIRKNYVSYYFMPVYACPKLLDEISAPLKKRMQGKSCFNFTKVDEELLLELKALTAKGYGYYKDENLI
ncbi:hypothetical protein ACFPVX_07375 [Cohnella faecalis]|uniref:DUF1801 domain-containing protein n=1 Tax=Cohnella faecalis TaxID=2315694 RepID=A0A398CDQ7_9BACL|nr:hypothetical protein [Cohnella faecalis]RIE00770.1 hypothetical protein D3H35_26625 [Cohnella faecalis]